MRWIILFFALSACMPMGMQVVETRDDWLGTMAFTAREREIHRSVDGNSLLTARPVIATGPDGSAYGVFVNMRRRDRNIPTIERVTSGSTTLSYASHGTRWTHCVDGCQRAEVGLITLAETAFRIATHTGLPLRIWGQHIRAEGFVPA